MSISFARTLGGVSLAHAALLAALILTSVAKGCAQRPKETIIPFEFKLVVPLDMVKVDPVKVDETKVKEPDKESDIPDLTKPKEKPKPAPKPKDTQKDKIAVKTKPPKPQPNQKILSPEEIKKLLSLGPEISDRNVIPEDSAIYDNMIKTVFYNAWQQPNRADVGDAFVTAEIVLAADGSIVSCKIVKRSGVAKMDESVQRALESATRVPGVPSDYIKKSNPFTIIFELVENE